MLIQESRSSIKLFVNKTVKTKYALTDIYKIEPENFNRYFYTFIKILNKKVAFF